MEGEGGDQELPGWEADGRRAGFGYLGNGSSFRSFVKCPDEATAPTHLPR
jgi:hypothetical protein